MNAPSPEVTAVISNLKGRAVLTSGASTGIGAAAARAFGRNGAKVAVKLNFSVDEAEGIAGAMRTSGGEAVLLRGDVTQVETATEIVTQTVEAFGHFDVLFNNAVSPGVIMTPFQERFSTAEQLAAMQITTPMERLGSPEECVGAFLYQTSEQMSGYVIGQIIEVNGGQYIP
jgi:NAD(P)-dependent dehydrogenase (short-subunit alcohol dehydrogenase family)